jgi:hypothetical protein
MILFVSLIVTDLNYFMTTAVPDYLINNQAVLYLNRSPEIMVIKDPVTASFKMNIPAYVALSG